MATGDDAVQATVEMARIGVSTVIEGVATGIIEIGAATPVVAPLCVALLKAKDMVEGTSRNKDGLQQLSARCDMITVQVIDRCRGTTPVLDVSPLVKCIEKLAEVAQRYHDQGTFARMAQFRRDGDDIQRLRDRIEAIVPIMGLTGVINIAEGVADMKDRLEDVQRMLVRTTLDFDICLKSILFPIIPRGRHKRDMVHKLNLCFCTAWSSHQLQRAC